MEEQKTNQNELLYNPKNWAFLAFFLSPILPAIFYYRNCKILGGFKKGRKVIVGTTVFVLFFIILTSIFALYSFPILILEATVAAIIAKKFAKTQQPAYEEMKTTRGLKGGRNEAPLALVFLAVVIFLGYILPYTLDKYVDSRAKNPGLNYENLRSSNYR